jgi:Positive regulator of sigma E activity
MRDFIEHDGVVKNISKKTIFVSISRNSACAECQAQSACLAFSGNEQILEIPRTDSSFGKGEKVMVRIYKRAGLKAVWYAFAFPLALLFISVFITFQLKFDEIIIALTSLSAVALYYFFLFLCKDRMDKKFSFELEKCEDIEI